MSRTKGAADVIPRDLPVKLSKKCQEGQHYSRCMAKYCTCKCHKTGH